MPWPLILVPISYLVGRLPSALIVAGRHGRDPLSEGSGNPGATNVARVAGRRAGVVVLIADMAKGFVCAAVGSAMAGDGLGMVCGVAAVVGHVAPLTRKGGKGVATAAGVALAIQPWAALVAGLAFAGTMAATRIAALASIAAAIAMTVAVVAIGAPNWEILVFGVLAGLIIGRHTGNLRRLRAGTEHRSP
jgi:glycerol-3-phosphate acyltransferase PlsY